MAGKKQIAIEIQIKNIKQIKVLENQLKKLRKEQRELAKTNQQAKKLSGEEAKVYQRKDTAIRKTSKALRENKKALADVNKGSQAAKKGSGSLTKSFIKGAAAVGILISAFRRVNQIISSMLGIFTSFEFVMAKVQAVSGASADEFKQLSDSAQALGRSTFFTAEQVGQLQLNYSKLGFTTEEILAAQRATLDLAVATGSDLARAATVAGAAVRGFGLDASETQRVVDVMAVSFSSSAMDMEKWQTSMTKVAPIAKAAGFSIEDTTAIMSKLTDTGIEASIAGTSLRNILLKMQDPSSDLTAVFGTTIHSLDQLLPAMNKFVAEGGDMADVMGVVDIRQAAAFESMLSSADATLELRDSLLAANGEGERMAGIVGDTLHGAWLKMKSALEGIAIVMMEDVGGAMKDTLVSFAKWLNALVDGEEGIKKFKKGLKTFGTIVKWTVKLWLSYVVGVKAAYLYTKLFGKGVKTTTVLTNLWNGSIKSATAALKGLKAALISTGIGLVIVLIGELIANLMFLGDEAERVASLQEKVNEKYKESQVKIELVKETLDSLRKTRELMNKIMDKEGENLKNNAVETEKYNRLKKQEAVDINTLNGFNKIYNQDLINQKTHINDITSATNTLIKAMKEKALATVFSDIQAQIIKTKVEADIVKREMQDRERGYQDIDKVIKDIEDGFKGKTWYNALTVTPEDTRRESRKNHLEQLLDDYGLTINEFKKAIAQGYYKKEMGELTKVIEGQAGGKSIADLLSIGLEAPGPEKPDPKAYAGHTQFKKDYDTRIKILTEAYRKQTEVEVAYYTDSEQLTVEYRQQELLTEATFAREKLKAKLKANRDEISELAAKDNKVAKATGEFGRKMASLKAKQEQILLDIKRHGISEEEKVILDNYESAVIALELEESTTMMSKIEFTNRMLLLEADYLTKKAELHAGNAIELIDINNSILKNNVKVNEMQKEMMKEQISAMGGVGSALTSLAGDNESLNFVKEAGNKISMLANTLSTIASLNTNLETLSNLKKAASENVATGSTIAGTIADTLSLIPKAIGAILNQGKGDPYSAFFRMIAMAALVGKVMGMYEGGGVIDEKFADGGMVRGKSHKQGGEKFNVGGRLVELEGGEAVINKRSTSMFRDELSSMNQAGGGVKFADGGLTNLPSFTKSHFDALNQQGMMGAMGQGSRVVVVESDITETQNTVSVIEAQATF
jgi:TP901 family phage tail tape measure protein